MVRLECSRRQVTVAIAIALLADCSGGRGFTPASSNGPASATTRIMGVKAASQGALGPVLTAANGGTITGWDVDAGKNYGLLSAGYKNGTALETFDLSTAKITKIGTYQPGSSGKFERQLIVLKILAHNVALIDDLAFDSSNFQRDDTFPIASPAQHAKTTGKWTPPHRRDLLVNQSEGWIATNQSTTTDAIMADRNTFPHRGAGLEVLISDVAQNSFQTTFRPPASQVFDPPYDIAQDTATSKIVIPGQIFEQPFDPFEAPSFDLLDPKTNQYTLFSPNVGSGSVMGQAIDPATHMMCTTTSTDSNVEFYDLKKKTGFAENLPNGEGEGTGGGAVAVDETHHLFLVTQPAGILASASVYVYDEQGSLQESIAGFNFSNVYSAVFANIAVNPKLRVGYVPITPSPAELQSFTY